MGLVNVIFIVIVILIVDCLGRKFLLIIGFIGMVIGMFGVVSMVFLNIIGIGMFVFIIIYIVFFMMLWGLICWVFILEIFFNKIRGCVVVIVVVV